MLVERRERVFAIWLGATGNGRNPLINGRRQPSRGGTSRMTRECQVRFCERLGVKFPGPTRHFRQINPLPTLSACPLRSDRARPFAPQRPTRWPSRPAEFHPEPLPDPDLNLSIHPARATARRLPPSIDFGFLPSPVDPISKTMACPLRSTGITPLQHYYEAVRPSPAHLYFRPRGWSRLCLFP